MKTNLISLAAVLCCVGSAAGAPLSKCIGADGKVTYTDGACRAGDRQFGVDSRTNTADHSSLRKHQASPISSERNTAPAARVSGAGGSTMAPAEKANRLRSLQMDIDATNASQEKRRAAREEMSRVNSSDRRLTADEERKVRNARIGLDSGDPETRRRALSEVLQLLQQIYSTP